MLEIVSIFLVLGLAGTILLKVLFLSNFNLKFKVKKKIFCPSSGRFENHRSPVERRQRRHRRLPDRPRPLRRRELLQGPRRERRHRLRQEQRRLLEPCRPGRVRHLDGQEGRPGDDPD